MGLDIVERVNLFNHNHSYPVLLYNRILNPCISDMQIHNQKDNMIYLYLLLIIFAIYLIRYIHQFIVINKTELKLIFNRATSFRNNPYIRQTLLLSTLKLILRLIRKTIFKV